MTELILFHHALGLTDGVHAFADDLRAAGHVVHVPDLFEGRSFSEIAEGVAYAEEVGFGTIVERGAAAAEELPDGIVYAGMSLGVMPAHALATMRQGARGALFLHACVGPWASGLPLQVHLMADDDWAAADLAVAHTLEGIELFIYPGDGHVFTDRGLPDYDESAAALVRERVLAFL